MRDLFDDFMDELRRRQAGEQPGTGPDHRKQAGLPPASDDDDAPESDPRTDDSEDVPEAGTDDDTPSEREPEDGDSEPVPVSGPVILLDGGAGGRRRTRRRGPGGPNDGAGLTDQFGGRRIALVVIGIVVLVILLLAGSVLDLWTDVIWYRSVGFDSVFWTRLWSQFILFIGTGLGALIFLLVNIWLAGRLVPPPDPDRPSSLSGFLDRLATAGGPFEDRGPFGSPGGPSGLSGRGRSPGVRYRGPFNGPGNDPSGAGGSGRPPGRANSTRGVFGDSGGLGGSGIATDELPDLTPVGFWLIVGLAVLLALGLGVALSGQWETIQLWLHQVPFGTDPAQPVTDPVFHRDIGFFLFQLPFLRLVQSTANGILLVGLIVVAARYGLAAMRGGFTATTPIRVHLAVLGGLYLLSVAAGYQLDKYDLSYSTQGFVAGVSYTDQNARFLAFDVLTVVAALAAALLVGAAFTKLIWPFGLAIGVWLAASVVLSGIYPQLVQRFSVEPNQYAQETPYIANNISMTRLAFGLDGWHELDYNGESPLTAQAVAAEAPTFTNARLWDYRPLGATLDQIQTVRQYYDFTDVDTDRYELNGETRQVMLAARELAQDRSDSSSWVNQRLTYTHGIGIAMVPVNSVTPEGLPLLLIKDLPPVSVPGAPTIAQPRIYFGERPSSYVIVDTNQPEFDYPSGTGSSVSSVDQAAKTTWSGTTGIRLENTLTRLLFAARFKDLNLLISDQITPQSQLLMHRSLSDRLQLIAPFLRYDKDPYIVIGADGNLYYIQDAYTVSDRFPDAQPFDPASLPAGTGLSGDSINYLRNSVKVVMNAYTGTMGFYAADPSDPILRAYEGVFPALFQPLDSMPSDLRGHVRIPEELFDVQTRVYATYHVTATETFYRRADLWTVPTASGSDTSLTPEAYYVVMRMPGEPNTEFLLLQPLVPAQRPNMIAWVAARNDGTQYGEVRVYRFPQDTSVRGPTQIEAQIDADPVISAQISLWNQSGSKVIRGNLIVLPVQNSLIYLQPVYLQSTTSAFPQFQKIVVASATRIVWGNTLGEAVAALLAGGPGGPVPTPTPTPTPGPSGSPGASPGASAAPTPTPSAGPIPAPPAGDLAGLIAYANLHFQLAQDALKAGDFARYGAEIAAVQQALQLLDQLAPGIATPAPSAVPAPTSSGPAASPSP